ncbi:hypothetical protein [Bartonella sp. B1099]|uniref:hypothetical protein n=1 Tax=Bartonella sp. B1099 TaxID=2911422 RepID=UPI0020C386F5|nr:hypothetical protein [Bartonella sp. B1099]
MAKVKASSVFSRGKRGAFLSFIFRGCLGGGAVWEREPIGGASMEKRGKGWAAREGERLARSCLILGE